MAVAEPHARVDPARLGRALEVVRRGVGRDPLRDAYPGAVVAVAHHGDIVAYEAMGDAALDSHQHAMREDSVFDLASLTKVLATTTAILLLVEQGALALHDRLADLDPDLKHTWLAELTPHLLLTHTSGVPWVSAFEPGMDWLARAVGAQPLFPAGQGMEYSCTNFLLLQRILERIAGVPLDVFFAREIARPLDLRDAHFLPLDQPLPATVRERLVPTESRAASERGEQLTHAMRDAGPLAWETWQTRHTPAGRACGVVHDENAAALGGVAGNAGLFGTAVDVLKIGIVYAARGATRSGQRFLSAATVAAATRVQTAPGLEPRGLGWQFPGPGGPFGDLATGACFGHTGFTGTALWIDPSHDVVAVLLTNCLQFGRTNERILRIRPLFFNALQAAVI